MCIRMQFVKSTLSLVWKITHQFNNGWHSSHARCSSETPRMQRRATHEHSAQAWCSTWYLICQLPARKSLVIHSWRGPRDIALRLFPHKADIFDHQPSQTSEIASGRNFQEPSVLLRAISVHIWQPSMLSCIVVPNISLKVCKEKSYRLLLRPSD